MQRERSRELLSAADSRRDQAGPYAASPAEERGQVALPDWLVVLVDKLLALTPKLRAAKSDAERQTLQNAVTATDQQIDALVYDLYGLTEDEIKLVEGNAG
jgi:Xaa-Pro aminopeptidase